MTAASLPNISALKLSSPCNSKKGLDSASKRSLEKFEQLAVGASMYYVDLDVKSETFLSEKKQLTFLKPSPDDGNCLFYSLLTLLQEKGKAASKNQGDLRREIVDHMKALPRNFGQSTDAHARDTHLAQMRLDKEWATDHEIDAAANLYDLVIHVWILPIGRRLESDASLRMTYYPENQKLTREAQLPIQKNLADGVHRNAGAQRGENDIRCTLNQQC